MISIMLATIMQAIDTTIANVALPHIQGSLSAAQDQITWIRSRRDQHIPALQDRRQPVDIASRRQRLSRLLPILEDGSAWKCTRSATSWRSARP
jgi:DHA2 family multidrug resistance protein